MSPLHIALGSNVGDRRGTLDAALDALGAKGVFVEHVSNFIETDPVGGPGNQGRYLNGVALASSELAVADLLKTLQHVETSLGRVRVEKDGPRTIDLDLLAFGDAVIDDPGLVVPHPRLQDRRFVLEPLVEIAPGWQHPVFGRTSTELLTDLKVREDRLSAARPGRELLGLRAMVTGSTSGIGRAIAIELAAAGADVIVHGRRVSPAAEDVRKHCRVLDVRSEIVAGDCADPAACERVVDEAWRLWNGLDVWIHNAGADTLTGPMAKATFEEKLETLFAVDVRGTMLSARRVGNLMKRRGQGTIVAIGWDQSETGMEGDSGQLFSATKAAVTAFAKSLSLSLAPEVRVNVIAPGWIRTAWGEGASAVWHERVRRETPLRVWGTPEDVAAAARWVVSPAAKFISGQTLRVNGGVVR